MKEELIQSLTELDFKGETTKEAISYCNQMLWKYRCSYPASTRTTEQQAEALVSKMYKRFLKKLHEIRDTEPVYSFVLSRTRYGSYIQGSYNLDYKEVKELIKRYGNSNYIEVTKKLSKGKRNLKTFEMLYGEVLRDTDKIITT